MRRGWVLYSALCAILLVMADNPRAAAQDNNAAAEQPDGPSIISSAWSGLTSGLAIGGAGGYLVGRRHGWNRHDWRAVGLGMGIGALSGAGFGLVLGIADKAGAPGGRFVARDMAAGAGFGAVIGLISGGIAVALHGHAEHLLFGTAVGVISGAGLGIITGIIEGISKRHHTVTATSRLHIEPSLALTRQVNGSNLVLPGLSGRF